MPKALEIALIVIGTLVVYESLRFLVKRRVRNWLHDRGAHFVRSHSIRLESARFIDRVWLREALAQDPTVEAAIAEQALKTRSSVRVLRDKVDDYVDEIAPIFSVGAYYGFGKALARRIVDFTFAIEVDTDAYDAQLAKVPDGAVRVYVINHRANLDPLVISYALMHRVPMSYAVGEWALVWPLDWLFRRFGGWFVRRGEKDPLYHVVLERFVQLLAGEGAVTGFFIEGGLSRDGALRRPRTGLLDYIVKLRRDQPDREIVFLPVGLNYDRVFEDRILMRDTDMEEPHPTPTRTERLVNFGALLVYMPMLFWANLTRYVLGAHRRFGYAALAFGEPLRLTEWPGGSVLHLRDGGERKEGVRALAEELLERRIARVVPATPVPILCTAFLRQGANDEQALHERVEAVLSELRAVGAPILIDDAEQVLEQARYLLVRRRVLKRVLTPTGTGWEVRGDEDAIVRWYANSIRHHLGSAKTH